MIVHTNMSALRRLRDSASQAAIWQALRAGVFQTFSSDHCPCRYQDDAGKTGPYARTSFRWVPNGIPGIAARLPILFSEGVSIGRISLQEFAALTATNHAKIYGLNPRKGSIIVGADADIVLRDAEKKVTLTQDLMQHGSDYTPYEGFVVTGWPVKTFLRGKLIVEDRRIVGELGAGQLLPRELPLPVKPLARNPPMPA